MNKQVWLNWVEGVFNASSDRSWTSWPFVFLKPRQNERKGWKFVVMICLPLMLVAIAIAIFFVALLWMYFSHLFGYSRPARVRPSWQLLSYLYIWALYNPMYRPAYTSGLVAGILYYWATIWAWNRRASRLERETVEADTVSIPGSWPPPPRRPSA